MARKCGMRLRENLESPMMVVNFMSWNNSMTIRWLMTAPLWSRLMKYSHFPGSLSTSLVCYQTSLLPEALLPSLPNHGGILLLLRSRKDEFSMTDLIGTLDVE